MRAKDFINEQTKLNKNHSDSIPHAVRTGVPKLDIGPTNFYWKYRTGLAASFSPDSNEEFSPGGPANDDLVMIGYSDADNDIIHSAHQRMGFPTKKLSNGKSKESHDVHKVSPVSNWNNK